jgi:hypothetical protein
MSYKYAIEVVKRYFKATVRLLPGGTEEEHQKRNS